MKSDYRKMRMILFFDLPVTEEDDLRSYRIFVRQLKKIGFYMLQYSVYAKSLTNASDFDKVGLKVINILPKRGHIIILKLTENQYDDMIYLSGEKNRHDMIVGSKEIVYFGGGDFD